MPSARLGCFMRCARGISIPALDTLRETREAKACVVKLRKTDAELNDTIKGRSNNSFDASGNSSDVIREDWMLLGDSSRRVNSGVMLLLAGMGYETETHHFGSGYNPRWNHRLQLLSGFTRLSLSR